MASPFTTYVATGGDTRLPDFTDPPVIETVLSIQFAPIQDFGIPHFGRYWECIRPEFGKYQAHPALLPVTERLDSPFQGQVGIGIQILTQPDVRCWFLDDTGGRLIQLQRDRFIHNWRQITGTEKYPHYPTTKRTLETEWKRFCAFLMSEKLELPQVNQCEITYVNHIEYGKGWKDYGELNKVIAPWSGTYSGNFLPPAEGVNLEVHYRLPGDLGRLHITAAPVIRGRDVQEILQVTIIARGAPKSSKDEDIFGWMDLGREWIVKGFTDFTTISMHKNWGRTS